MPVYFPRALGLAAAMAWLGAFSADDFGSRWPYLIASEGAFIFLLVKGKISVRFVLLLILIGPAFFCDEYCTNPKPADHDLSSYNGYRAVFQVKLAGDPEPFGHQAFSCTASPLKLIFPRPANLDGRIQLIFSSQPPTQLKRGDFLRVKAALQAPEDPIEPWKFQTKEYLKRQSIFCIATTEGDYLKLPQCPQSIWATIVDNTIAVATERRHAILEAHIRNIGPIYAALLQSIVLGDKTTELPKQIKNDFRHVGLSHVTAASGFNLTVVVGIAYWLTALICKTGVLKRVVPLAAIGLFVVMAGPSPSVVRAAICCSVFLLAAQVRRKFSALAVLSLSVLLSLAFDPILATDVGAELSYAATFGIICLAKNIAQTSKADHKKKIQLDLSSMRRWLLDSLSVLFGVQASVLPIQLLYFWQSGLAFIPANLIVEPIIAPLTVAGFISSFLIALANGPTSLPLKCLAYWVDQFACLLIKFLLLIVDRFSHFPNAVINFGPPSSGQIFGYYLVAFFFLYCLKMRRHLVLAGGVYLIALGFLLYRPCLHQPIICVSHNFVALLGVNRKGFYLGEPDQAEKFLAYYGAQAEPICLPSNRSEFTTLPIYNSTQTSSWSIFSPDRAERGKGNYVLRDNDFEIRIKPNFRIKHDRRLEGDRKHPFTLFCSRGLCADLGCEWRPRENDKQSDTDQP